MSRRLARFVLSMSRFLWSLPIVALVPAAGLKPALAQQDYVEVKPFAEHHIVLQLSDRVQGKRALVLSVANNLLKAYDPDRIEVEVVAFGPGVDILRAKSPDRAIVDSLVSQGVTFDVCMNTIETMERETGKPVALNPKAHKVAAGVAQMLMLAEHGYTIVRP